MLAKCDVKSGKCGDVSKVPNDKTGNRSRKQRQCYCSISVIVENYYVQLSHHIVKDETLAKKFKLLSKVKVRNISFTGPQSFRVSNVTHRRILHGKEKGKENNREENETH